MSVHPSRVLHCRRRVRVLVRRCRAGCRYAVCADRRHFPSRFTGADLNVVVFSRSVAPPSVSSGSQALMYQGLRGLRAAEPQFTADNDHSLRIPLRDPSHGTTSVRIATKGLRCAIDAPPWRKRWRSVVRPCVWCTWLCHGCVRRDFVWPADVSFGGAVGTRFVLSAADKMVTFPR